MPTDATTTTLKKKMNKGKLTHAPNRDKENKNKNADTTIKKWNKYASEGYEDDADGETQKKMIVTKINIHMHPTNFYSNFFQ